MIGMGGWCRPSPSGPAAPARQPRAASRFASTGFLIGNVRMATSRESAGPKRGDRDMQSSPGSPDPSSRSLQHPASVLPCPDDGIGAAREHGVSTTATAVSGGPVPHRYLFYCLASLSILMY